MKRLLVPIVVVAAILAGSASAAESNAIVVTEANPGAFPDRAYILTLPTPKKLTTKDVKVQENGESVNDLTVVPAGDQPGSSATMLVIDASNSMAGRPIADAMVAARAFAAKRPTNAKLGVIVFNGDVKTVLEPTTDPELIKAALAAPPELGEGTKINDALVQARDVLTSTGATVRSVVLLSDGADVGSKSTKEESVSGLANDKARVFAVGLKSSAYDPSTLENASSATGGTYVVAKTSKELASVFSAIGFKLGNEYLVLYRSFASPQTDVNVKLAVAGFPPLPKISYTSPALAGVTASFHKSTLDRIVQSPMSVILLVVLILLLLAYAVSKLFSLRGRSFRSRMSSFVDFDDDDDTGLRREEIRAALADADTSFQRSRLIRGFADDVALCRHQDVAARARLLLDRHRAARRHVLRRDRKRTDLPAARVHRPDLPPHVRLDKVERKRRAFGDQLSDNLDVLAQSLRAGHSLPGALSVVADSAPEPSHEELARVISDERLGVPLEDALGSCVTRMQSRDLEQVALVALLQRDAGGNAAEVIDQVAYNIRTRQELRRLARTLTAQGRMTRWILTALPIVVFFGIYLIDRNYLSPLWQTTTGKVGLIVGIIMVTLGSYSIKRIVNIKV